LLPVSLLARGVFPSWGDIVAERPVISIVRLDHFSGVPDPRQKGKVPYPPPEILPRGPCGVLCGAESCAEIEEHGELKLDVLRRPLPFDNGVPSRDTFRDVFDTLDAAHFQAAFIAWTAALREQGREVVARADPSLHLLTSSRRQAIRPGRPSALGRRERPTLGHGRGPP